MNSPSDRLLALIFALMGAAAGAFMPFLSLSLERRGYSGQALGGLMALLPLVRILAAPSWSLLADRLRLGGRILQGVSFATAAVVGALALEALGPAAAIMLFAALQAPAGPLLDAITLRSLESRGADPRRYGQIRLWASAGFLTFAGVASVLVDRVSWPGAPQAIAAALWLLSALATLRLPPARAERPAPLLPALRALASRPGFGRLLLALMLHGSAINAYDAWYSLHMGRAGHASAWVGGAIALGVLAEIAFFAAGPRLLGKRAPLGLLAAAMTSGVLRWSLTAWLADPMLLTALQVLHGVGFGLFWLSAVEIFRRAASPEIRASAQALLLTTCYGLGPLLTSALAALLVEDHGTSSLFAAAAALEAAAALLVLAARPRLANLDA